MTAKIAKFPFWGFPFTGFSFARFSVASGVPAAPGVAALAYSNDNKKAVRTSVARPQRGRPVLFCRWRPATGGGLECHWDVEPANGAASAEPDPRRMSGLAQVA
jgi:hypothetical protein